MSFQDNPNPRKPQKDEEIVDLLAKIQQNCLFLERRQDLKLMQTTRGMIKDIPPRLESIQEISFKKKLTSDFQKIIAKFQQLSKQEQSLLRQSQVDDIEQVLTESTPLMQAYDDSQIGKTLV